MENRFKILISDAARAQELFDLDELERFAEELKKGVEKDGCKRSNEVASGSGD